MEKWKTILHRQLAADFCCTEEEVRDGENHFTEYFPREGRRKFRESDECFLKICVVNGKILASGKKELVGWCRDEYAGTGGEWFFEAKNMKKINRRLLEDGLQIAFAHPFFIPLDRREAPVSDFEIRWYEEAECGRFKGDGRFTNALSFDPEAPDIIAAAAFCGSQILGMAGASMDSPSMWQIGIDTLPEARGEGIGTLLVTLLKNRILDKEILPFYGTGFSHLASQRVALSSGFIPAWCELLVSAIDSGQKKIDDTGQI